MATVGAGYTPIPLELYQALKRLKRVASAYFIDPRGIDAERYENEVRETLKVINDIEGRVYS